MKVEMEISWIKAAKLAAVAVIGIIIGYALAVSTVTAPAAGTTVQMEGVDCITNADLNRQDIQASILLSRFCEGQGLQSSVFWQQDDEGNVFGTPICLPPPQ